MQLKDFTSLEDAKQYPQTVERMISHDMVVTYLTKCSCITSLQTSSDEKAKGFYLAVLAGVQEFNLMPSHPVGQEQRASLTHLVEVGAVTPEFQAACLAHSVLTTYPFKNVTEYEWLKAKGNTTKVPVTQSDGYIKINVESDVTPHRPQVYVEIQSVFQRITSFGLIEQAGDYLCEVPREHKTYYVDDVYGVIT